MAAVYRTGHILVSLAIGDHGYPSSRGADLWGGTGPFSEEVPLSMEARVTLAGTAQPDSQQLSYGHTTAGPKSQASVYL